MSTAELFSVAGKVALVTGGSRGIGRMMARALVVGGARVYITSRRGCDEVARELCREGECVAVQADLTSESDLRGLAAAIRSAEPELHVLVHSAGAHYTAPLEDHAPSAWDEAWSTNVKSLFRLVQ